MKKIFLYMTVAMASLTSCGSLDINDDPNHPSGNVPAELIMPAIENSLACVTGDGLFNPTGFFVQYFEQVPTAQQYNKISWYDIKPSEQIVDRCYRTAYLNTLQDVKELKSKTKNTADLFAATVLRAYTLQLMVDATGETPYSEANNSNISKPKYDEGADVYKGILKEMDDAEAAMNPSDVMATKDLLNNKNIEQWKGFANALRLRMYLRMISGNVDAGEYTTKLKALVNANKFFSGDIKFDQYSDEADKRNPWYSANAINLNAKNHTAAVPIISYMEATSDPRIDFAFKKATEGDRAGSHNGSIPGTAHQPGFTQFDKDGYFSLVNYYATKPVMFFTQAELQFLLAECYMKYFNDEANAKAAYEAAIEADFAARGVAGAETFMEGPKVNWDNAASNDDKLKLVYMQKWVALLYMDHMESWSEMRRTNVPTFKLTGKEYAADPTQYKAGDLIYPYKNYLGEKKAPLRLHYSFSSSNINENVPEAKDISTTPVFWDK